MTLKETTYTIKIKILYIILFLSISQIAYPQSTNYLQFDPIPSPTGLTLCNSMGYAYNPAVLHRLSSTTLSLSVAPSKFGLRDLSPGYILFGLPITNNFKTAISGYGIGNKLYNEFSSAVGMAYSISEYMTVGASFEYFRLSIDNFVSDDSYQAHIGTIVDINDYLVAGVCMKNVNNSYYQGGEKTSSQFGSLGIGFLVAPEFSFDLGVQVSTIGESGFSASGLYTIEDVLRLRVAALTAPRLATAGLSFLAIPYIDINVISSYHDILGWSHSFGISIFFD